MIENISVSWEFFFILSNLLNLLVLIQTLNEYHFMACLWIFIMFLKLFLFDLWPGCWGGGRGEGADVDAADDEGHAALCFWCKSGYCVCLHDLLEQRAHPKRFEETISCYWVSNFVKCINKNKTFFNNIRFIFQHFIFD